MPADIAKYINAEQLQAALPPGVSLWLIRGKVLHVEYIDRPVVQFYDGGGAQQAGYTHTDTYVALRDRDAEPPQAYEVRFQGRVDAVAPGDNLELIGHQAGAETFYAPRLALSMKHNKHWIAHPPLRNNDPGFRVREDYNRQANLRRNSYEHESDGWFLVNAPRPANAPPPVDPVRDAVGKLLGNVAAPAAAPEPVKAVFGKLLGLAKQAAAAPPPPAFVTVDLWPVYQNVAYGLQKFMPGIDAEEAEDAAQVTDYGDDLPPP